MKEEEIDISLNERELERYQQRCKELELRQAVIMAVILGEHRFNNTCCACGRKLPPELKEESNDSA